MKQKRGQKKKRAYHAVNRPANKGITRRDAPTEIRAKLFHGGPDGRTIRLCQLIGEEMARLRKWAIKTKVKPEHLDHASKLPDNYLSARKAENARVATKKRYVLRDEIDSLWNAWSAQCERALLDRDADWFNRQARAIELGDRRTDAEKDRCRFEAEVVRLLTVECFPERKILAGDCFGLREDTQPLTEDEKREIRELEHMHKHAVIEDMIGKSYRRNDDGEYVATGKGLILEWTLGEARYSCRFKNRRCARDAVREIAKLTAQ
jgi:hypothetical protein